MEYGNGKVLKMLPEDYANLLKVKVKGRRIADILNLNVRVEFENGQVTCLPKKELVRIGRETTPSKATARLLTNFNKKNKAQKDKRDQEVLALQATVKAMSDRLDAVERREQSASLTLKRYDTELRGLVTGMMMNNDKIDQGNTSFNTLIKQLEGRRFQFCAGEE